MLEILAVFLTSLSIQTSPSATAQPVKLESIPWHETAIFQLPNEKDDPMVQKIVDRYLDELSQQGIIRDRQGVWIQSDWLELADYQGNRAIPGASLTKIATTLTVLRKLGLDSRFETKIYHTGTIENGILRGDLIVEGDRDPFFVWEEAIALSNALNELGINRIEGSLLVNQQFYMNFKDDSLDSAKSLHQGLQSSLWSAEIKQQFQTLPITTPRPKLSITGETRILDRIPLDANLLLTHQSLPLVDILRQMNIYSNNKMSQMLADIVGGATVVADYTTQITGVDAEEIQLINGSGLGEANQISPRAAVKMLMEIDSLLQPHNLEVKDIFPLAGRDRVGTMENRDLPVGTAVKTGTLNRVSALAGVIPIDKERRVWFAVINSGWQIEQFRQQQDNLLGQLASHWQQELLFSDRIYPNEPIYLGDPARNKLNR